MIGNPFWNRILKLGLVAWLYSGKLLLTLLHAIYWDMELPFARMKYIKAIRSADNQTQLMHSLSTHFTYRNDPLGGLWDFYYLPHITWALRHGDCDDFAWMAADALSRSGISTVMATFIPQKIAQSHVIVVYESDAQWFWAEVGFWYNEGFPAPHQAIIDAAHSLGGHRTVYCQSFTPVHSAGEVFKS
jgi:hypothetical protein